MSPSLNLYGSQSTPCLSTLDPCGLLPSPHFARTRVSLPCLAPLSPPRSSRSYGRVSRCHALLSAHSLALSPTLSGPVSLGRLCWDSSEKCPKPLAAVCPRLSPGTAVRLVTHTTSLSPATTSCRQVRLIDLLKLPPLAPVSAASAPTAGSRPSSLRCTEGPPAWTPLLHLLPVAFPGSPAAPAASLQAAATPSRFPFHPSLGVSLTLRPLACGSLCLGHTFSSVLLGQLLNSSAGGTRPQQLPLVLVSSVRLRAAHRAGEG